MAALRLLLILRPLLSVMLRFRRSLGDSKFRTVLFIFQFATLADSVRFRLVASHQDPRTGAIIDQYVAKRSTVKPVSIVDHALEVRVQLVHQLVPEVKCLISVCLFSATYEWLLVDTAGSNCYLSNHQTNS